MNIVRSDNGTELKGRLDDFFWERGIVHQLSADYTPEQNGRAERLNRTLMDKVRAMLKHCDLAPQFWGVALDTACYVRNCMPMAGQTVSPHTLFYGEAPDVRRLRVFGCLAYVHVFNAKRKKLNARTEAGFFAGYERDRKVWRVYAWRKGRFLCNKSRNVGFDEDQTVNLPRRQGLQRSDEELQHMALTGADGVCDPSDESEFMPVPGPDQIAEPILDEDVIPPLEDSEDDGDAEETKVTMGTTEQEGQGEQCMSSAILNVRVVHLAVTSHMHMPAGRGSFRMSQGHQKLPQMRSCGGS